MCVVRQCESDVSSVTCACARIRACVRESVAVGCVVCLTVSVLFLSATILTRPCYHLPRRRPLAKAVVWLIEKLLEQEAEVSG